jgi:hypothetical protein
MGKNKVTYDVCENCGQDVAVRAMKRHVRVCIKHPGDDELAKMYAENSIEAITRKLRGPSNNGPSSVTVRKWLKNAGVALRTRGDGQQPVSNDELVVDPDYAPMFGYSCDKCPEAQVKWCQARNTWSGGLMACEAPEEIDLLNGQAYKSEEAEQGLHQELATV